MVGGVLAAAAVTIVTATTARQLNVEGVVYRPFAEPAPKVDVGLAWRADDSSPVLKALVQLAEHFATPRTRTMAPTSSEVGVIAVPRWVPARPVLARRRRRSPPLARTHRAW